MSKGRDKGTFAESAVAEYAQHSGFPFADRLPRKGNKDIGDVGWCPGVISEVKNCKTLDLPGWLKETAVEKANAKAEHAFLVVKPEGVGRTRVGMWWSVMYSRDWRVLFGEAGSQVDLPEQFVALLGSSYKKPLADLARNASFQGLVEVRPVGVKNELDWYILTRLSLQAQLLRAAGYGNPEVLA